MSKRAAFPPCCVMIGPPGAGKTTALAAAGATAIADTPGRLTIHDPAAPERKEWQGLVSELAGVKPPPASAIVVLSIEALWPAGRHALQVQLAAIRKRLDELSDALGAGLPTWVLFTKADLIPGFAAFMGNLDDGRTRGVWGTADVTIFGVDALAARLAEEMPALLHEEPDPAARAAIFAFPQHFRALREPVVEVMQRLFSASSSVTEGARARGFYFGCGAEGGFFVHDLLTGMIPAEIRTTVPFRHRGALLRNTAMAVIALATAAMLGAWGASFVANRALIADIEGRIEEGRADAALLSQATVADAELGNVAGILTTLRDLPAGYGARGDPAPLREGFGLTQRGKLVAAAETAYGNALERLLRSRLILQIEQTVQAAIADPIELYEPLKAYLMLGGEAPASDDNMIVAWFERDWAQHRYPGSANHQGREELEGHLRAMLELGASREHALELDRPLIEAAQRSLSRIELSEFAWALLRSGSYAAQLQDFSVVERGGPQAPVVFEAADGRDLATINIPGLYTWAGFNDFLLPQLATVARRVVEDRWIMGAGGEQVGVEQQLRRLGPQLLDRYGKDFLASWSMMFDRLKLKPLTADRPDYAVLDAASSPTSPLRALVEAIAAETGLTRAAVAGEGAALSTLDAAKLEQGLALVGIEFSSGKSQTRAGSAFAAATGPAPGANIEAQFRPFQMLVEGTAGRRPIDALVQNFSDVHQSLLLAAGNPSLAEHARANLQLQVHNLRANASRFPNQLATMIHEAADEFESDVARTSVAQLSRLLETAVTAPCTAIVADAYPFARGSQSDVPLADFARLFAPGGEFERFFAQNLAALTDISGQQWQWKQDSQLGSELSPATLKAFQQAASIRNAFFSQDSGTTPSLEITFTPFSLHGDADMALLDVHGQIIQSYRTGNVPTTVTWPDARTTGGASLSLTPEIPGRAAEVRFDGPWALMRLLDTATLSRSGQDLQVQFVIGGRDVSYTVKVGASDNPLSLPALSEFRCPEGL